MRRIEEREEPREKRRKESSKEIKKRENGRKDEAEEQKLCGQVEAISTFRGIRAYSRIFLHSRHPSHEAIKFPITQA